MSAARWTPEQLDDFRRRQHRADHGVRLYGYVGDANANEKPGRINLLDARCVPLSVMEIPVLTDAIAGPGAVKPKRVRTKPSSIPYFQQLAALLRPYGIPDPIPEYRFDAKRRWRFDFAWPAPIKLALELQGGLFNGGRHTRGAALLREYEKHNAATLANWRILYFSPDQLTQAAEAVRQVFGK